MRILLAAAEVAPFAKTGGLGDVCGALPKALAAAGHEVMVFVPYYRQIRRYFDGRSETIEVLGEAQVSWGDWSFKTCFLTSLLPGSTVPVIFVDNGTMFDRDSVYGPDQWGRDDNIERFTYFSRAVIRGCELLGFAPDIVHAHDWHTALLPIYLEAGLRETALFRNAASVLTIHNLAYQGRGGAEHFAFTGLPPSFWSAEGVEYYGDLHLMKGGINFANQITTVSPNYADEIQTQQLGAGVEGLLQARAASLSGILNGIDVAAWDPATDPNIPANFNQHGLLGKTVCKEVLIHEAGLGSRERTPLVGVVSRLVHQKGLDLLVPVAAHLLRVGAQMIVLGTGDAELESAFRQLEHDHPGEIRAFLEFDDVLSHRVYAGCDLFLMPSRYEPCGLSQMYALRYGAPPVVRMTGGLVDTVVPYDGANAAVANGFGFYGATPGDLFTATWISLLTYREPKDWRTLQQNGMALDFSWEASASQYEEVYRKALSSVVSRTDDGLKAVEEGTLTPGPSPAGRGELASELHDADPTSKT